MAVLEFDPPERFVVGTVGQPGERVFFLQASTGNRVASVSLEKTQVLALAEKITELLDALQRIVGGSAQITANILQPTLDNDPLSTPVEEDFRVGAMSLTWDQSVERVVLECVQLGAPLDVHTELAAASGACSMLRVRLTDLAARSFVRRALAVAAAGRPPCPFCGNPLDAQGHICPRANGYRR